MHSIFAGTWSENERFDLVRVGQFNSWLEGNVTSGIHPPIAQAEHVLHITFESTPDKSMKTIEGKNAAYINKECGHIDLAVKLT